MVQDGGSKGFSLAVKAKGAKINMKKWLLSNPKGKSAVRTLELDGLRKGTKNLSSFIVWLMGGEEEITLVKFRLAPRPDGLNLNFVKANWGVIKDNLMKFVQEFQKNGDIVKDLNKTFIALIPKSVHPETLKDFRPINLVSSMYKILAKVLANRLKTVMDSLVDESQMAFVKNLQILDSFVVAEEIIHSWRKDKMGGLLVKLNFKKAYDSMDHAFLDFVMAEMGFRFVSVSSFRRCVEDFSDEDVSEFNKVVFNSYFAERDILVDVVWFRMAWRFKNHGRGSNEPIMVMVENLEFCYLEAFPVKSRSFSKWIPPLRDALKFNVDGSVIRSLLRTYDNLLVSYASRDSNMVADGLAKKGLFADGECVVWNLA
ncbi:hypothetical protein Ddye_032297 [Dipteronia dyeriana]|uniref:Reverse transcriptase domain-containing protein n=1 Tax=Dipteronia dyeriana TaxID=168575 RepID=A0AAD9TJX3_9ROSI|nr:hypothetical protein Ddye_032297 [Dipteronia dyeriana]